MRRIGGVGMMLLTGLVVVARAGEDPTIDRVLDDWQKRMASVRSLEVTFRKTSRSEAGVERMTRGRVVLAVPDLALIDETRLGPDGQPTLERSRSLWTGDSLLQFAHETGEVTRLRRLDDRSGPPVSIRVPFLFGLSVERARELYDWKVLSRPDGRIWLGATLKAADPAHLTPDRYAIELERTSLLPRKVVVSGKGRDRDLYELGEVQLNAPVDEDLRQPCLDPWLLKEPLGWLTRWIAR